MADYSEDADFEDPDPMDDGYEPVGSCEWCGANLYPQDDDELCAQCVWHAEQNRDDDRNDDRGLQPVT